MSGHGRPVVTVDGPAASGKSTTARELARHLGFLHLDSGALYRALTHVLLDRGVPEERWERLSADELEGLDVSVERDGGRLRILHGSRALQDELRTAEVTEKVSRLAAIPGVRSWLFRRQREAARGGGVVAEGRDMGSVVFPEADLKIYLVADLEERARRRLRQRGEAEDAERLRAEAGRLAERDRRDRERSVAPLRQADDAVEVDTTDLTIEDQVKRVATLLEALTRSREEA